MSYFNYLGNYASTAIVSCIQKVQEKSLLFLLAERKQRNKRLPE